MDAYYIPSSSISMSSVNGATVVQDLDRESCLFLVQNVVEKLITSTAVDPGWGPQGYRDVYYNPAAPTSHAEAIQMQHHPLQLEKSFHAITLGRRLTPVSPKQGQIPTGGDNVGQDTAYNTGAPG